MEENIKWIYGVNIYMRILHAVNIKFIKLIGLRKKNNLLKLEELYMDIFYDLSKLIPMSADDKNQRVITITKDKNSGIFGLIGGNAEFVKIAYKELIAKYNYELYNIKSFRNRFEHNPHSILLMSSVANDQFSQITINYKKRGIKKENITTSDDVVEYSCNTDILMNILKELNDIYKNIQEKIKKLIDDETIEQNEYTNSCLYIDFNDYNEIFMSPVFYKYCKIIGK